MIEIPTRFYPVGIQSFGELRREGYVYVDKTQYLAQLFASKTKYVFLSRPRRFGKSLLVSTFHEFFAGNRKPFEGLYIDSVEKEWTQHPVLHFDMSRVKSSDPQVVERSIDKQLRMYEAIYGRDELDVDSNARLEGLIRRAYEQTGKQVVLLIDEYDAPMMEVLVDEEKFTAVRQVMRNFYSPIKACDPYLRFVFMTGITKLAQMSIFSELNNMRNISMLPQYAGICGITKEELDTVLAPDIELMAEHRRESGEQVREKLRLNYDGYHFSHRSPDVFNPYSLFNAFNDQEFKNYWFSSATPKFLIDIIRNTPGDMQKLSGEWVEESRFDAAAERPSDLLPLLYHSGYLTIKAYDKESETYLLEMPNKEVREGMTKNLILWYVNSWEVSDKNVSAMRKCLRSYDLEGTFRAMQAYLATKPYLEQTKQNEAYYQDMLFVILTLLGCQVDMEVRSSRGRVDMVLYRPGVIYVMELKIDSTPEIALQQIDDKAYAKRFEGRSERIIKVGLSFSTEERNLTGWLIGDEAR